jgi:transposase-like protein
VDTSNQIVSVRVAGAKKRRRSVEERRKIVEATLQPGASVSRVARRHDVNANQVFHWRKLYREGRLGDGTTTKLLPMRVADERSVRAAEGDGIAWRFERIAALYAIEKEIRGHSVGDAQQTSAEWITERLYGCTTANRYCQLSPFGTANYGSHYTNVSDTAFATVDGVTRPLGSLPNIQLTMEDSPSFQIAVPSALSRDGTSFQVTVKNNGGP